MASSSHPIAKYKVIPTEKGNKYRFFCEASGMAICTTNPIYANSKEDELSIAWNSEGRKQLNKCHKCGKWVSNVMYNANTFECVYCSVWEEEVNYCSVCGFHILKDDDYCRKCGRKLIYEGEIG